jgi:hypothetical protein
MCLVTLVIVVLFLFVAAAAHATFVIPIQTYKVTARELHGSTNAQVLQKMGKPQYVVGSKAGLGGRVDVPRRLQVFKPDLTWPVHGEVLIYHNWNTAAYFFPDKLGVVEHVAITGT